MNWPRAMAAVLLSLVFPGVGHVYLRDWIRAILFATFFLTAVILFVPITTVAEAGSVTGAHEQLVEGVSTMDLALLVFVVCFCAIDAGLRGASRPRGGEPGTDAPACPNCGRELDLELEFCHWCTYRFDAPRDVENGPG